MMKKLFFLFMMALVAFPAFSQKDSQAKSILDRTYNAFKNAGGVKAKYAMVSYKGGKAIGGSRGNIQIKGTKFLLKTSVSTIWFDGKTQWNYVYKNQEVNVSNPSTSELQNLNPYYILSIYQKGFNYKMGAGKGAAKVVELTAQNAKQSISHISIGVSSNDTPQFINITRRDGTRTELKISGYKGGQNFSDGMFSYNKREYPKVEIVDLR